MGSERGERRLRGGTGRARCREVWRRWVVPWTLVGLAGLALSDPALGARRETPESADSGAVLQQLLLDPGAALREANRSLAAGDRQRARWLLRELAERHPIVADYADLQRARMRFEAQALDEAVEIVLRALEEYVDSPLRAEFYHLLGDARAGLEDEPAARSAWTEALDATRDDERRAALHWAVGSSLERSGKLPEAGEVYKRIWSAYPLSEEAGDALKRIEKLEAELGESLRSGNDWLMRADRLYRKRRNDEALADYDQALALGLDEAEGQRARRQRAHTLFRMRRYSEATKSFSDLPQEDDVALWRARSIARAGDVPGAVRELEALATRLKGRPGVRARYLAGLLLEEKGHGSRARSHFRKVAGSRGGRGLVNSALWQIGWAAYLEERYSEAIVSFDKLRSNEPDPIARLRARYWRARTLERLKRAEAAGELEAIAREYPLSYYGWRAQSRVNGDGEPGQPPEIAAGSARLSPSALARPRILIEAEMFDEANDELRRIAGRARGLRDRLDLAQLYTEAEDYHGAQRLVVDAYTESLARGPVPNLEALWWYAWPAAYAEIVGQATDTADGVDAFLVYSIMREESGYRPAVVSISGARGLLQIMSDTGERLARDVGRRNFSADDLFEPETNIGLGSHYLAQLSRRFGGQLSAAVAGYNAGPTAVSKWLRRRLSPEDDEWIESIPYDQTRAYVKRVLRSLHAYQVLY